MSDYSSAQKTLSVRAKAPEKLTAADYHDGGLVESLSCLFSKRKVRLLRTFPQEDSEDSELLTKVGEAQAYLEDKGAL